MHLADHPFTRHDLDDFRSTLIPLLSFQGLTDEQCISLADAVSDAIEAGEWPGRSNLPPETRERAREVFEGRAEGQSACRFCGGLHGAPVASLDPWNQPCPRVRRVERSADGAPSVIEYWPAGQWEDGVIFPADVM